MRTIFVEWHYTTAFEDKANHLIHHFELLPAGMNFYVTDEEEARRILKEVKANVNS